MKLPDFKVEQWMNDYENEAVYNLTDTCVKPLVFSELMAMADENALMDLRLDYGTITGDSQLKKETHCLKPAIQSLPMNRATSSSPICRRVSAAMSSF